MPRHLAVLPSPSWRSALLLWLERSNSSCQSCLAFQGLQMSRRVLEAGDVQGPSWWPPAWSFLSCPMYGTHSTKQPYLHAWEIQINTTVLYVKTQLCFFSVFCKFPSYFLQLLIFFSDFLSPVSISKLLWKKKYLFIIKFKHHLHTLNYAAGYQGVKPCRWVSGVSVAVTSAR